MCHFFLLDLIFVLFCLCFFIFFYFFFVFALFLFLWGFLLLFFVTTLFFVTIFLQTGVKLFDLVLCKHERCSCWPDAPCQTAPGVDCNVLSETFFRLGNDMNFTSSFSSLSMYLLVASALHKPDDCFVDISELTVLTIVLDTMLVS